MTIAPDLKSHLLDGEKILWTGAPASGLLVTREDWIKIPFSLVFAGISGFIFTSALSRTGPDDVFFIVVAALFLSVGVFLVAGRFLLDAWLRRRTRYAVTSRRILISRAPPFGALTAMSIAGLPDVKLIEHAGGRGTIRFGHVAPAWVGRGGSFVWTPSLDPTPQFLAIEDARRVFSEIQRAQNNLPSSPEAPRRAAEPES